MRGDDPEFELMEPGEYWLLPACAGMIPVLTARPTRFGAAPRMRGDDPDIKDAIDGIDGCPPHARG